MSPQHNVGLQVNADADNPGDRGKSNGFEVLMVIMEEERLCCICTAIHAVAFLFHGCPASSSIRKLGTTIHDRFDDVIDDVELI